MNVESGAGLKRGSSSRWKAFAKPGGMRLINQWRPTDLMASESMWTGAMRSNRNLTISRKGLVGCLGNVSLRVISL